MKNSKVASVAYRGYLIRTGFTRCWVEKGGSFICWAKDIADARRSIDNLLDEDP